MEPLYSDAIEACDVILVWTLVTGHATAIPPSHSLPNDRGPEPMSIWKKVKQKKKKRETDRYLAPWSSPKGLG